MKSCETLSYGYGQNVVTECVGTFWKQSLHLEGTAVGKRGRADEYLDGLKNTIDHR